MPRLIWIFAGRTATFFFCHEVQFSFTCLKTYNAVISGIRFCGKSSIFLCTIRRPSVCPFVRKLFFSLSHHFRDHWSDFFDTCLRCFRRSLVVSARKWFRSVDRCGRHHWYSPLSDLLRNHWRNFVETLHINSSQCLDVSARKWVRSVKNKWPSLELWVAHYSVL